jgi:hypothetical protein
MVTIKTNHDDDDVYITSNKNGDIKVNIGTKLLLENFTGEVINLESTTTPTITLKVISDSKQFAVDYPNPNPNPNFSHKHSDNFNENERILLMNDPFGFIEASSLDNTDKQKRPIKSVKIYKDVEPIVISERESPFPLDSTSDKWHRDDDYKNCEICKKEFGMFTRKHHCRRCGRVVCNDCSPYNKDGHKVCNECSSPFATAISKSGGYKRRQSKSKRKNKRSLRRRRTSKRSNIHRKNKKVTKRLRKSRRRARR